MNISQPPSPWAKLRRRLPWGLLPAGLQHRLSRRRLRGMSLVVNYHAVEPAQPAGVPANRLHNTTPEMLRQQLVRLKQLMTVLPLDELAARSAVGKSNAGLAAITFDDGYASVLENGLPILEELELPATFFLTTRLIDERTFWRDKVRVVEQQGLGGAFLAFAASRFPRFADMRPDQLYHATKSRGFPSALAEEALDGFLEERGLGAEAPLAVYCTAQQLRDRRSPWLTFGNHSHSHYVLSSLDRRAQRDDIECAQKRLEDLELPLSEVFAIPFGGVTHYNQDTLDVVAELGFRAYATSAGKRLADTGAGPGSPASLTGLHRSMPRPNPWFLLTD